MVAAIQRYSLIFSVVVAISLLGFASFALRPEHQPTGNLPKSRFRFISMGSRTRTPIRSQIPSAPVFDPVLTFATFLGGQGGISNSGALLVDSAGNSFLAGTIGSNFTTTPGVVGPGSKFGAGLEGLYEVDPTGQTLIFATYLPGLSEVDGLAFDSAGDIYVAGRSLCPTPVDCPNSDVLPFPTSVTPYQSSPRSIAILKLNSTATAVLAATYLGGSSLEVPYAIASDADSDLYITGYTSSNDFPTMNPLQGSLGTGGQSVFVTKFNPTLSTLSYSTYLGNDSVSIGHSIAVDSSKDAYVAGAFNLATDGNNLLITQNAFNPTCGGNLGCGFLSELSPNGSTLLYSTYAGLSANAVAVDTHGNAFIGGLAQAPYSFSQTLSPCFVQGTSSFVAEIGSSGALSFSTCLGGEVNPITGVTHLTLDSSGNIYVVGVGAAGMTLKNPIQTQIEAASSFVAAVNPNSPAMIFSSYFGGTDVTNTPSGVGVDSSGEIYVAGTDTAGFGQPPLTIFPVFNAMQPVVNTPGCGISASCQLSSAFLLKIAPTDAPASALTPGGLTFGVQPLATIGTQTITVFDEGSSPLVISDVVATGDFQAQVSTPCQTTIPAAGGSCTISVSFTPTAFGTRTGTLTLTDNSAGSPHTVQLTGTGGQGVATLAPKTLSFDNQTVGTTSAPQTVTLTNTGTLSLQISHIGISGTFSETNTCGTTLSASSVCTVTVTFAPTAAGASTGTLTFADSAGDSPQIVALTGTGGAANSGGGGGSGAPPSIGLGVASGGSTSATVAAGASATYALSIGGAGMAGTASLACGGAPTGAMCSVPATVPISASAASTFNATVTTTAHSNVSFYPNRMAPWSWALAAVLWLALLQSVSASRFPSLRCRFVPILAVALCACGGGNYSPPTSSGGTPAGSYTITVTAKIETTTQTQNLTLVVH